MKLKQKNYNEAIPLYKEYLAENPDSAEARLNMGIAYLKTGFADAAIAEFETVLKSSPNHPDAVLYMGLAHLSKGKLDEAIVVLENYRNSRKPLVEEEVMHQMTLLEDLYASDKTLFEENPMIIVNRVETAVNNALAEQKRADRQALKMSKEQNNNKGCFAYDTNVLMADKSLKRIIDLRAGDTVQAYDVETEKMVVRKVTDTYRADQDHYYLINGELKITAAHPVFTTEGSG
ncbi:tetratricopeptide repeat protein [Desulfonema magnum]|uniref:tetratricopeptide repeat protein n=1 Tax=Desulfonema magnum TaxID=45655 RepID=UPI001A9C12EF|nr:tetratricopeptide repeat protein [Desulfonema magnum]